MTSRARDIIEEVLIFCSCIGLFFLIYFVLKLIGFE
jgi:hypothetical protein